MEAKDTVIPISECPYQPDGESDELYVDLGKLYQEKFMQGARKQAPISFKAGQNSMLKEVKEWIEENKFGLEAMDNYCDFGIDDKKWQTFLKALEKK